MRDQLQINPTTASIRYLHLSNNSSNTQVLVSCGLKHTVEEENSKIESWRQRGDEKDREEENNQRGKLEINQQLFPFTLTFPLFFLSTHVHFYGKGRRFIYHKLDSVWYQIWIELVSSR